MRWMTWSGISAATIITRRRDPRGDCAGGCRRRRRRARRRWRWRRATSAGCAAWSTTTRTVRLLARAPLALVVLVAAQEVEDARAGGLRVVDGARHEHGAGAVAAELEVEARQVIVDARAVGEAVEGGARLAVDAQAMQAQPAARFRSGWRARGGSERTDGRAKAPRRPRRRQRRSCSQKRSSSACGRSAAPATIEGDVEVARELARLRPMRARSCLPAARRHSPSSPSSGT